MPAESPLIAKLCSDATHLYVGVVVVSMFPKDSELGHVWGTDEGVEFALGGARDGGQPVTYVLRGFCDGTFESLTGGGASAAEAKALAERACVLRPASTNTSGLRAECPVRGPAIHACGSALPFR